MKQINITIGDSSYQVVIADNDELRSKGLMGINKLPENKGMLFIFDAVGENGMYMKNTLIPLQQIFMDKDREVIKTITRKPEDETIISCEGTKYVLEVNPTNEIEVGDFMEIEGERDKEDSETPIMKVLAPDGTVLGSVFSGQRIFSRSNTKVLIKQSKKAYLSKVDADYKRLGKSVFKYLRGLDNRDPEYVSAPENKKNNSNN